MSLSCTFSLCIFLFHVFLFKSYDDINILLSCSYCSIKVWTVYDVDLKFIKEIKQHTDSVYKAIPLSNKRFASCSSDYTVRVWKDDSTYECISTLKHDDWINSILQLRGKEVLVSAYTRYNSSSLGVSFGTLQITLINILLKDIVLFDLLI